FQSSRPISPISLSAKLIRVLKSGLNGWLNFWGPVPDLSSSCSTSRHPAVNASMALGDTRVGPSRRRALGIIPRTGSPAKHRRMSFWIYPSTSTVPHGRLHFPPRDLDAYGPKISYQDFV